MERAIDATEAATLRQQAQNLLTKTHVIAATTLGLVPVPLFDLALLVGNQIALVHGLSKLYGVPFDRVRTRAIVLSLLCGSAPVLGVMGLSSGAKLLPGIGTLLGSGSGSGRGSGRGTVAVSGGALSHAAGEVFVSHFESGGTLLNVDLDSMRRLFKRKVADAEAGGADAAAGEGWASSPVRNNRAATPPSPATGCARPGPCSTAPWRWRPMTKTSPPSMPGSRRACAPTAR